MSKSVVSINRSVCWTIMESVVSPTINERKNKENKS